MATGRNYLPCCSVEHLRGFECLAEDAPLLNRHVMEGVGDDVQDDNQLRQHPLLRHRLQRVQLNSSSNHRAGFPNTKGKVRLRLMGMSLVLQVFGHKQKQRVERSEILT